MKKIRLTITKKDWDAIYMLAELGINDSVYAEETNPKNSAYYKDFIQFRSVEARINKQLEKVRKK